jgi:hypothetical protein
VRQGGDEELERNAQRAAEFETDADGYDRAAEKAAAAGHQRRSRQFRESARASRKAAAEGRAQAPSLLAAFRARTQGARERVAKAVPPRAGRQPRQAAEEDWLVERWLRKLRGS